MGIAAHRLSAACRLPWAPGLDWSGRQSMYGPGTLYRSFRSSKEEALIIYTYIYNTFYTDPRSRTRALEGVMPAAGDGAAATLRAAPRSRRRAGGSAAARPCAQATVERRTAISGPKNMRTAIFGPQYADRNKRTKKYANRNMRTKKYADRNMRTAMCGPQ